jgi:hypothetical protein
MRLFRPEKKIKQKLLFVKGEPIDIELVKFRDTHL